MLSLYTVARTILKFVKTGGHFVTEQRLYQRDSAQLLVRLQHPLRSPTRIYLFEQDLDVHHYVVPCSCFFPTERGIALRISALQWEFPVLFGSEELLLLIELCLNYVLA